MISSGSIIFSTYELSGAGAKSLFEARLGAGVFRFVMGVAEVQIPQINRKRQHTLQNTDRIMPIDRKITQEQKRAEGAALPKAEWNHAFAGPFGGDPLDEET